MAFNDTSKLNVAFKKLVGKAQTDSAKEASNEAKFSGVTVASSTVIGETLPSSPSVTNLYDITVSPDIGLPVVEFLRLELVSDPSSNGHAFFARLPATYQSNSTNIKAGTAPFTNSSVLVDSTGTLQVIPPLFGLSYEAKPYVGGTSAKGSGTLIPPGDARDWYFDYFNGVFFQQTNVGGTPAYIECLVYVGSFGVGGSGSGSGSVKVTALDAVSSTLPGGVAVTVDGVSIANGDLVLFTNLSSNNNRIYKASGVGVSVTWAAQPLYENQDQDPSTGDSVRIGYGDSFKLALFTFNGTEFLSNDTLRFFDKDTKVDYWELSSVKSTTLVQGTTNGVVFSVTLLQSENFILNYSITRGAGNKQTGQIILTSDGVTTDVVDTSAGLGSCGITFNSDINSGNIRLLYTATSGSDALMKFFAFRWSNASGGPGNLINYTPTGGGGVPAQGTTGSIQIRGNDGNLDSDTDFEWDATGNALNLGGARYGALEGPLTLLNNQPTPVVLFSYPVTDKATIIDYVIYRGSDVRTGDLTLVNNGTDGDEIDDYLETGGGVGISLDSVVNGANIDVRYTSTNTGSNATIKYTRKRWS